MGWLELLPLLRRVLPLLDRLMPMLESAVAGRFAGRAQAEDNAATLAGMAESNAGLLHALEQQRRQSAQLGDEMRSLSVAYATLQSRLTDMESGYAALVRTLRYASAGIVVLLLVSIGLLIVLVAHRG